VKPHRTDLEFAAGKLISAVQREWHLETGEPCAVNSEMVMHSCHDLLKAAKVGSLAPVLGENTIVQFLGADWVSAHPEILAAIAVLEAAEERSRV
jgi:hypothetical protein